ncbi:MAG: flagellar basal body-associated protein FliL [Rhodoblastus sp.]
MKKPVVMFVVSAIALTLGGASGWWGGKMGQSESAHKEVGATEKSNHAPAHAGKTLRELKPIVTNLSAPAGAWVRMELALIVGGPADPKLEQRIAEFVSDCADFFRTLSAQQVEGVNGLRRLREDLLDRARFRIGKDVESVLIQTLVVQ